MTRRTRLRTLATLALVAQCLALFNPSPASASWTSPNGFSVFNPTDGHIPGYRPYTVSIRAGSDWTGMRAVLGEALGRLNFNYLELATLRPGVVDRSDPVNGEILVQVDPSFSGVRGTGGPTPGFGPNGGVTYIGGGRVSLSPQTFASSTSFNDRLHLVSHELGHALGLDHYDWIYNGQYQVMASGYFEPPSYRSGDYNGLWYLRGRGGGSQCVPPALRSRSWSQSGEPATVDWQSVCTPSAADWVGLYPVGAGDGAHIAWRYTTGDRSGTVTLPVPQEAPSGQYELRLFSAGSYTRLATSPVFWNQRTLRTLSPPYTAWSQPGPAPLDGFGNSVVVPSDPTARAGQVAPSWVFAGTFAFAGSSAVGTVGLGAFPDGKYAVFSIKGPDGVPREAAIPFAWTAGRQYFLYVYQLSPERWGAWVYDNAAATWTEIGLTTVPSAWGKLVPHTYTTLAWWGPLAASCSAYPAAEMVVAPATGWAGGAVTAATPATNATGPGDCPSQVVSQADTWVRYRAGA